MKSVKLNLILNMIKQLVALVAPFITTQYITRVLSTENYGLVSFATSVIYYFTLLSEFGLSTYAVREGSKIKNNKYKINYFSSEMFTIKLFFTIISFVALIISTVAVDKLQNIRILLLLFSITFISSLIGMEWINSVYENFFYITIRQIILSVIYVILIFTFVKNYNDYLWYSISIIILTSCANISNFLYNRKKLCIKFITHIASVKQHIKSIVELIFNNAVDFIYIQTDIVMLGIMTNEYNVGIYSMPSKIYIAIIQSINALIASVSPRISLYFENNKNEYKKLAQKIFDFLAIIIIPVITGMIYLNKEIIKIIASNKYILSTISFVILSIAILFASCANYFTNIILIQYKKDKVCFFGSSIGLIINIILNIILIPIYKYNATALTTLITEMFLCIFYFLKSYKIHKIKINFMHIVSIIIGCVTMCFVVSLTMSFNIVLFLKLIISIIVGMIVYFSVLLLLKNHLILQYFKIKNECKK